MRFGSLFTGIGGFDLGLERAGWECAWQVEADAKCRQVLRRHWPDVPIYDDVRTVGDDLEPVDLICGGFPCQNISTARAGGQEDLEGDKSGLWWQFSRVVRELRPRFVIVENVAFRWRRWVPDVRSDLAGNGYASVPLELRARTFGADHERPRVFVVADADGDCESLLALHEEVARLRPLPRRSGHWREAPSRGFRVDDGLSRGMDRLRMSGNAVVPQIAEWLGRQILRAGVTMR